jgi:type IV pilus assembly protein PilB
VCKGCRQEIPPHPELCTELQLDPARIGEGKIYKVSKCSDCHDTGYKGRTGVYEVLQLSPKIRKMILDRASSADIKATGIQEGMLTLRMDALRKMLLGDTTAEEVLRETAAD